MASNDVDIKKLLEAGAHFGHKTSRWHPKMAPYIHSKRGGIHIIDLVQTADNLSLALDFVEKTVAENKTILIVGTKKQAQEAARKTADETSSPYVVNRWIGGMLTNSKTIQGRIKYLKDLEEKMQSGQFAARYNKLELQRVQEEIDHMNWMYGGIKAMPAKPNAVFVFDALHDDNAIKEAQKLSIPVVAIVDTNVDPSTIDWPIPCNDDSKKTHDLIGELLTTAINSGKSKQKTEVKKEEEKKEDK